MKSSAQEYLDKIVGHVRDIALEVLPEKFSIMDRHTTSFRSLELLILIRAKRRLRKRRDEPEVQD
jgi:hypothetical protein